MKTKILAGAIFVFLLLASGCIKEKFNPSQLDASQSLNAGIAVPIGFSHLGVEKYLSDSTLKKVLRIASDGFLSLYYSTPIDSGVMDTIISVRDVNVNKSVLNTSGSVIFLDVPGKIFDYTDTLFIPVTTTRVNAHIDSIKLISADLQINISSANLNGTIVVRSNELRQNGAPFSTTRNLPNAVINLSLANYTIVPGHDPLGNNVLKCVIQVHLVSPAGPINPGETIIDVNTLLTNLSYETIYGSFGGYTYDFPSQIISTPFFKQIAAGKIDLKDPKMKLLFSNSAGVPIGVSFSQIKAVDRNNVSHLLTGPGIPVLPNPRIIRYPSISQIGQTIKDSLTIDRSNSNLPDIISAYPDSITFKGSVTIPQSVPPVASFVNHDSKFTVSAVVEVPLWGKADLNVLVDTTSFNYLSTTLPRPQELNRLIIRISLANSFPVAVYPQVYLLDSNLMMLDSLFTGKEKIDGAPVDNNGKAIPQKLPPIDIDLPSSRIDNLLNTRYFIAKGRIVTTDYPQLDVKFYSTSYLDINIGVIAQLKMKTAR